MTLEQIAINELRRELKELLGRVVVLERHIQRLEAKA